VFGLCVHSNKFLVFRVHGSGPWSLEPHNQASGFSLPLHQQTQPRSCRSLPRRPLSPRPVLLPLAWYWIGASLLSSSSSSSPRHPHHTARHDISSLLFPASPPLLLPVPIKSINTLQTAQDVCHPILCCQIVAVCGHGTQPSAF
jgi:hypothetical protein